VWAQEAYIKASNSAAGDEFGMMVSLDGDRLAVGAPRQGGSGTVYVFRRIAGVWTEEQIIKATNPGDGDLFGSAVSLFGDRLAVGAFLEDSGSEGINSTPDESAPDAGAVYLYHRVANVWSPEAYVKAVNSDTNDFFGHTVSLSGPAGGSADTLAVTAIFESSGGSGVTNGTGTSTDNSASHAGAVYVFARTGTTWAQQAFIKAVPARFADNFGCAVAVSGNRLAAASCREDVPPANDVGFVYTYVRTGNTWAFDQRIGASNGGLDDSFGLTLALKDDLLVVGSGLEDGSQPGINPMSDDNAPDSGAAYMFRRTTSGWVQEAYIKALDPSAGDGFGGAVASFDPFIHPKAISVSGDTIVIGASQEDSKSTGINGDPLDASAPDAGAVYIFR
jgi:hypothetical protein